MSTSRKLVNGLFGLYVLLFSVSVKSANLIPKNFIDYEGVKLQKLILEKTRYYSQLIWGKQVDLFGQPAGIARWKLADNYYLVLFSDMDWGRIIYVGFFAPTLTDATKWEVKYIRGLGRYGSGSEEFKYPRGIWVGYG